MPINEFYLFTDHEDNAWVESLLALVAMIPSIKNARYWRDDRINNLCVIALMTDDIKPMQELLSTILPLAPLDEGLWERIECLYPDSRIQ